MSPTQVGAASVVQQLKVRLYGMPESRCLPTGSHGSEPSRGSKGLCGRGPRSLPERGARGRRACKGLWREVLGFVGFFGFFFFFFPLLRVSSVILNLYAIWL
jgi:hypothetical protein